MISLEDYYRYSPKPAVQATLRRQMLGEGGTYEEFIEQLYADIDESIYELQASRELRQNDSEDRISLDILVGLKRHGYHATHDSKTGGHIDLSVRMGSHSWIGEAKKDGNFHEGFLQLTSRYVQASGNYSHDQGGLLFYMVKTADALGKLNTWRVQLAEDGSPALTAARTSWRFIRLTSLRAREPTSRFGQWPSRCTTAPWTSRLETLPRRRPQRRRPLRHPSRCPKRLPRRNRLRRARRAQLSFTVVRDLKRRSSEQLDRDAEPARELTALIV